METKPYPFTPEQLAWLHDLETTEEPQTRGSLHRIKANAEYPIGWCPLGRGAVTLGLRESPCSEDDWQGSFHGSAVQLIPFKRLHLRSGSGELVTAVPDRRDPEDTPAYGENGWSSLTELNDELRCSFAEIAAYIRANPWNVFTDPEVAHD